MPAFARFGTSFSDALSLRSFSLSGGKKRMQKTFFPFICSNFVYDGPRSDARMSQVLGGAS